MELQAIENLFSAFYIFVGLKMKKETRIKSKKLNIILIIQLDANISDRFLIFGIP